MNTNKLLTLLGGETYAQKIKSLFGASLIAYWKLDETTGTTALDYSGNGRTGAYTGVTLASTPGPTRIGGMAPLWDGTNDLCNIYTASLVTAFNALEGSVIFWCQMTAGAWTDSTLRYTFSLRTDATNRIYIYKSATNNTFSININAGGTAKGKDLTISPAGWFQVGLTWSTVGDRVRPYYNGAQQGADLSSYGTWVGALGSTNDDIGSNGGANFHSGYAAHVMLLDREATAAEILVTYNLGI